MKHKKITKMVRKPANKVVKKIQKKAQKTANIKTKNTLKLKAPLAKELKKLKGSDVEIDLAADDVVVPEIVIVKPIKKSGHPHDIEKILDELEEERGSMDDY